MTAVILWPAVKVLAAVALVVAGVEDETAMAERPVTLTPLIWMFALNEPGPVTYVSPFTVPA